MSDTEDVRAAIIRDICRKEGHGPLAEVTTVRDYGARSVYICNRGCGAHIVHFEIPHTLDEIRAYTDRNNITGVLLIRGKAEVWPEVTD